MTEDVTRCHQDGSCHCHGDIFRIHSRHKGILGHPTQYGTCQPMKNDQNSSQRKNNRVNHMCMKGNLFTMIVTSKNRKK